MWLVWRCFSAKRTENVPLFGAFGLAAQLGVFEYTRDRNFRKRMKEWLHTVALYWPECPAKLADDGGGLLVGPARAISSADASIRKGA